jgi:hypothetical protein
MVAPMVATTAIWIEVSAAFLIWSLLTTLMNQSMLKPVQIVTERLALKE